MEKLTDPGFSLRAVHEVLLVSLLPLGNSLSLNLAEGRLDVKLTHIFIAIALSGSLAAQDDGVIMGGYKASNAEFPGGSDELYKFMNKRLTKKIVLLEDESASVKEAIARFIINERGEVDSVAIVQSSNITRVDELFLNTLKRMPKWKPGKMQGRAIRQEFLFPLKIEVEQNSTSP